MRIVYWGTFDLERARNRILRQGLEELGHEVELCHFDVWKGFPDKTLDKSLTDRLRIISRYLICYPILLARLLHIKRPDVLLVGYLGIFDTLVLWPLARILRIPIVLDSFVSLYNTVVEDRKYISKTSVLASLVLSLEKLAFSTAKLVLVDTDAHSSYYQSQYKLPKKQLLVVPVGAQQVFFSSSSRHIADTTKAELRVLFYSTFIPLHGIATVVRAIELSADSFAEWTVVGSGQHFNLFDKLVKEKPGLKIKHLLWASTEELARLYTEHDVALGIFGNTDKAARVIPNKVYETIASGVPLITRKSPAIDELVKTETPGLWQIEANNAKALVDALEDVRRSKDLLDYPLYSSLRRQITPKAVAFHLEAGLKELFNKTHTVS